MRDPTIPKMALIEEEERILESKINQDDLKSERFSGRKEVVGKRNYYC